MQLNYTKSRLQRVERWKETVHCKWVLIVTKLFNTAVNDFGVDKSARCSRVLVITELVASGIQCIIY